MELKYGLFYTPVIKILNDISSGVEVRASLARVRQACWCRWTQSCHINNSKSLASKFRQLNGEVARNGCKINHQARMRTKLRVFDGKVTCVQRLLKNVLTNVQFPSNVMKWSRIQDPGKADGINIKA